MSNSTLESLSSTFASANRGPLTTIFTPPTSCLSETILLSFPTTLSGSAETFTTTKVFINHFSWGIPACDSTTTATIDGSTKWNSGYYYSPGICPRGWTSACQIQPNAFCWSTTLATDSSAVLCCPSNWSCVNSSTTFAAHGCSTVLLAGQTLTSVWPASEPIPGSSLNLLAQRSFTNWEVPCSTSAVCDAIPVIRENTDIQALSQLEEDMTRSTSTTTSTSVGIPASIIASTAISTSMEAFMPISSTSSGLSTGAEVAIGVTSPIALIALIVGIFLFFRRRHRNPQAHLEHHELLGSSHGTSDWYSPDFFRRRGGMARARNWIQ